MKLVLRTCSSDPDDNADCDFALVDLTREYAALIARRMDLARSWLAQDQNLFEVCFWDCGASFFSFPADESLEEHLPEGPSPGAVLPDEVQLPEELFERTECGRIVVSVAGRQTEVAWQAIPKHSSLVVETRALPRRLIQRIAAGEDVDTFPA